MKNKTSRIILLLYFMNSTPIDRWSLIMRSLSGCRHIKNILDFQKWFILHCFLLMIRFQSCVGYRLRGIMPWSSGSNKNVRHSSRWSKFTNTFVNTIYHGYTTTVIILHILQETGTKTILFKKIMIRRGRMCGYDSGVHVTLLPSRHVLSLSDNVFCGYKV